MQSLASLMSVKLSDVGNLDDFAESDEEEANGPGAPEARAHIPQPGGLIACHGSRSPRSREGGDNAGHKPLAVLGKGQLAHALWCVLTAAQAVSTYPAALIVQIWSLAESYRMGSQCLPGSRSFPPLTGCLPRSVPALGQLGQKRRGGLRPVLHSRHLLLCHQRPHPPFCLLRRFCPSLWVSLSLCASWACLFSQAGAVP